MSRLFNSIMFENTLTIIVLVFNHYVSFKGCIICSVSSKPQFYSLKLMIR